MLHQVVGVSGYRPVGAGTVTLAFSLGRHAADVAPSFDGGLGFQRERECVASSCAAIETHGPAGCVPVPLPVITPCHPAEIYKA